MPGFRRGLSLARAALVLALLMLAAVPASAQSRLQTEIERIAAASQGTVGVSAIHLPSGRRTEMNADRPFQMASTLKLPLGVYALHLGDRGRISLTEAQPVQREAMIEPGILYDHFPFPGLAISTLNAIELSITRSDNGATDIVYSRVGGPAAVNAWLQASGLAGINMGSQTVAQTFAAADSGAAAAPDPLARTATPRAMANLLARLHQRRLLGEENSKLLLSIMERTQGERLSLQLPPGTTVRHKTGTLFGAKGLSVNDVGLIDMPGGESIAIAVFINDSPESVSHSTRDKVIGAIARAIYDHFLLTR